MRAAERQSIPEGWAHEHMQGWRVPADASNGSQRRRLDCCISKVRQRLVAATGSRPSLALECEPGGLEVIGLREWRMVDVLYAPLHGAPDWGRKAWKCRTAHRCAGARSKGELQVGSLPVQVGSVVRPFSSSVRAATEEMSAKIHPASPSKSGCQLQFASAARSSTRLKFFISI